MPQIEVNKQVNIKLSNEEIETLKKSYEILKEVSKMLWINDIDKDEMFDTVCSAKYNIYYFMKCYCDTDIKEKFV